ncbi:hypothetical protein V6Z88_004401 [Aspergillus fumigatus]
MCHCMLYVSPPSMQLSPTNAHEPFNPFLSPSLSSSNPSTSCPISYANACKEEIICPSIHLQFPKHRLGPSAIRAWRISLNSQIIPVFVITPSIKVPKTLLF